jgi:hypothetical protein
MARLPIPGSDNGSWGDILNNYLSQSLTTEGRLKEGIVSSSHINTTNSPSNTHVLSSVNNQLVWTTPTIPNSAVGTAQLADGSVTSSKLASTVAGSTHGSTRSLLIYYAPPSIINAKYDDNYAAGILSRYDDVVLGSGLEEPSSPYFASTSAIISKISALSPDTVVWGYIDCGVTTGNISLQTLQAQIDYWIAIGAKGIFCDVIGYAYNVSRTRQNDIISYIHSKGVGAILNTYDPDEILSSAVNVTYNPSGVASLANSSDVLLLESWVCNSDAYASPHYVSFSDVKTRGDKARAYRASMGIRIFAVNIMSHNNRTYEQLKDYRDISEALARVWRLDGTGIAASTYASTGADVGVVTPYFSSFHSTPLRRDAPYSLNGDWTQVTAPDLGIEVNYSTNTHTWLQR